MRFRVASALALPFDDESFDVVWTEHVQMNIEDKHAFYGEIARVLTRGGRLLFHDVFLTGEAPVHYRVPWADDESISFLVTPDAARSILEHAGLRVTCWEDESQASLDWFVAAADKAKGSAPPKVGLHLLMGQSSSLKRENIIRNLQERSLVVIQAVMEKAG